MINYRIFNRYEQVYISTKESYFNSLFDYSIENQICSTPAEAQSFIDDYLLTHSYHNRDIQIHRFIDNEFHSTYEG